MTAGQPTDKPLRSLFKGRFGRAPSASEMDALRLIRGKRRGKPRAVLEFVKTRLEELETPAALWFNIHERKQPIAEAVKPRVQPNLVADAYLVVPTSGAAGCWLIPVVRDDDRIFVLTIGEEGWRTLDDEMAFVLPKDLPTRTRFDSRGRVRIYSGAPGWPTYRWTDLSDRARDL